MGCALEEVHERGAVAAAVDVNTYTWQEKIEDILVEEQLRVMSAALIASRSRRMLFGFVFGPWRNGQFRPTT